MAYILFFLYSPEQGLSQEPSSLHCILHVVTGEASHFTSHTSSLKREQDSKFWKVPPVMVSGQSVAVRIRIKQNIKLCVIDIGEVRQKRQVSGTQ